MALPFPSPYVFRSRGSFPLLSSLALALPAFDTSQEVMPLGFVNGDSGSSPENLFRSVPPVSKALIVGMVGTMLCMVLGVFSPMEYVLSWPLVWKKFHIWRLVSCGVFPGPPSIQTLFFVFSMGMYSMRYVI